MWASQAPPMVFPRQDVRFAKGGLGYERNTHRSKDRLRLTKPDRCRRSYHRRRDCMGRIGFQPVPNRPDSTHSSVALEVRTVRLQNRCCVGFRDRQDACPTAWVRLNIPTSCPPRGAVPVNARARFHELVSSQHARFAFSQGCDWPSYVGTLKVRPPFHVNS